MIKPDTAHNLYSKGSQESSDEKRDPETNAPKPIPISRDTKVVPMAKAILPLGARSAVQAKIVGIFIPMERPYTTPPIAAHSCVVE